MFSIVIVFPHSLFPLIQRLILHPINLNNVEEVDLTVEMPDEQSGHKCHHGSKDDHSDHSSDFPRSLLLLKFFVIGCRQELDRGIPVIVLEDTLIVVGVSKQHIKLKGLY